MAKLLKNILETYPPRSRDEKLFVDQHKVDKIKNKGVGTEDDKLFNASNIKQVSRRADRHGYEPGEDLDKYDAGRATAPGTMKAQRGVNNIPPTTTYEDTVDEGIDSFKAREILNSAGAPIGGNYHKLDSETVDKLVSYAKKHKYHAPKNANGSRGRYFHDHLQRRAALKEDTVDEGLRLIKVHTLGAHTAKVYKDNEWGEHRVKFYKNGKHLGEGPEYHTDDVQDAHDTAKAALKKYNESIDEGHSIKQLAQAADAHRLHRNAYLTQSQRKYQKGKDGGDDAAAAGKHDKAVQVADRLRWKLQDKGKSHTSQLKKEDIEQVDEVSKNTLAKYIKKANKNYGNMTAGQGSFYRNRPNASSTPFDKSAENRKKGIARAVDKLTKEEIEQVNEVGFANKFAPLKKTEPRSGYMRIKGGGVGYDSSNPDMRINRRAGLDKDIDWENDGKGAFDKQQKRMEKFKSRALKKEDEEILENIEEHVALLSVAEEMLNEDVTSALSPYYQSPEYHKDRASTHSLHCSDCNSLAQQHINLMDQATDRAVKAKHRSIARQYSELAKAHAHMTDHHYNEFRKARNKTLRSK
jgi:hypothetical protein